jgi:hypothetical protein
VEARDIDWQHYDQLKAQGRSGRRIAQEMAMAESTLRAAPKRRQTTRFIPVQRPVQPFDTGAVQRLERLEDEVIGLRRLMRSVIDRLNHPPV